MRSKKKLLLIITLALIISFSYIYYASSKNAFYYHCRSFYNEEDFSKGVNPYETRIENPETGETFKFILRLPTPPDFEKCQNSKKELPLPSFLQIPEPFFFRGI